MLFSTQAPPKMSALSTPGSLPQFYDGVLYTPIIETPPNDFIHSLHSSVTRDHRGWRQPHQGQTQTTCPEARLHSRSKPLNRRIKADMLPLGKKIHVGGHYTLA